MKNICRIAYIVVGALICLAAALLLLLICTDWIVSCDTSTVLDGRKYATIEDLHTDYVLVTSTDGDPDRDHFPRDLLGYVKLDSVWLVACTYAYSEEEEIRQDEIYVYLVGEDAGQYVLKNPSMIDASATMPLHANYDSIQHYYYFECKINGESAVLVSHIRR